MDRTDSADQAKPKISSPSVNQAVKFQLSNRATKDHPSQEPAKQSTLLNSVVSNPSTFGEPVNMQPIQLKKSVVLAKGGQSAVGEDPSPLISIQKLAKQTVLINPRPVPTVTQQAT